MRADVVDAAVARLQKVCPLPVFPDDFGADLKVVLDEVESLREANKRLQSILTRKGIWK